MLGLDVGLGVARAWSDVVFGSCTAMAALPADTMSAALRFWSGDSANASMSPSNERRDALRYRPAAEGRSWYRAPSQRPMQLSLFGLSFPVQPVWSTPGVWPVATWPMPVPTNPWQSWMALMSTPMLAGLGSPAAWGMPNWAGMFAPASALDPSTAALPFSTYRSDGGHAVAQITFPNDVVAAVAVPAQPNVFDPFGWATRH